LFMKKHCTLKAIMVVFLSFVFVVSSTLVAIAAIMQNSKPKLYAEIYAADEFMDRETFAMPSESAFREYFGDNYAEIMDNFEHSHQVFDALNASFGQTWYGARILPDFYGGSYYDVMGNAVILIAESAIYHPEALNIASIASRDTRVTVRTVEFSVNQLRQLLKT